VGDETIIKIVAITALAAINIVALAHGMDSVLTGTICSLIGGIAGYQIGIGRGRRAPEGEEGRE